MSCVVSKGDTWSAMQVKRRVEMELFDSFVLSIPSMFEGVARLEEEVLWVVRLHGDSSVSGKETFIP